jgi:hypothetical protein
MASFSLSANHLAPAKGGYEPQRAYDFFLDLNIPGASNDQIRLSTSKAFLPVEENEEIMLAFGNEKVYVAGQALYSNGNLEVRDFVDVDTYGALRQWRATVYDPVTGGIGLAANYKTTARLHLVGPDGLTDRQYQITGAWPQKISPSGLDYQAGTGVVLVEMTVRFDKALPI